MGSELKKIWGFHALFDCAACDIERVKSKANVCDFLAEMVREIDMVPFGAPYIERFATHDIDKSGISFFQMIETSNISGHLCEGTATPISIFFPARSMIFKKPSTSSRNILAPRESLCGL